MKLIAALLALLLYGCGSGIDVPACEVEGCENWTTPRVSAGNE